MIVVRAYISLIYIRKARKHQIGTHCKVLYAAYVQSLKFVSSFFLHSIFFSDHAIFLFLIISFRKNSKLITYKSVKIPFYNENFNMKKCVYNMIVLSWISMIGTYHTCILGNANIQDVLCIRLQIQKKKETKR